MSDLSFNNLVDSLMAHLGWDRDEAEAEATRMELSSPRTQPLTRYRCQDPEGDWIAQVSQETGGKVVEA